MEQVKEVVFIQYPNRYVCATCGFEVNFYDSVPTDIEDHAKKHQAKTLTIMSGW